MLEELIYGLTLTVFILILISLLIMLSYFCIYMIRKCYDASKGKVKRILPKRNIFRRKSHGEKA